MALSHGPSDASVIVSLEDLTGNQVTIDQDAETFILDAVSKCGDALLVRCACSLWAEPLISNWETYAAEMSMTSYIIMIDSFQICGLVDALNYGFWQGGTRGGGKVQRDEIGLKSAPTQVRLFFEILRCVRS